MASHSFLLLNMETTGSASGEKALAMDRIKTP